MSTNRDFDRIAQTWLAEGPSELDDRVLDAALDEVHLTHQRRRPTARWRPPMMNSLARLTATAVVAVVAIGGALYVMSPSVGPIAGPTPTPTVPVSPSPATSSVAPTMAGRIAFVSDRAAPTRTDWDIWVMNADGSDLRRLTTTPAPETYPAWSPDASQIAFVRGDAAAEVWIMDADGSNQRQLTNSDFWVGGRPSWSPDGARIAFTDDQHGQLYLVNVDGSSQTRITQPSVGDDRDPSWSPDGRRIAFANGGSIFTVRPDGSGRTLYAPGIAPSLQADGDQFDGRPTWARDGSEMAVNRGNSIWLENGSGGTNLTVDAGLPSADWPSWSPDGGWLTFGGSAGVPTDHTYVVLGAEIGDIYVIKADGSGLMNLTHDAANDWAPAWSSR